jgi:hypothetical protein
MRKHGIEVGSTVMVVDQPSNTPWDEQRGKVIALCGERGAKVQWFHQVLAPVTPWDGSFEWVNATPSQSWRIPRSSWVPFHFLTIETETPTETERTAQ